MLALAFWGDRRGAAPLYAYVGQVVRIMLRKCTGTEKKKSCLQHLSKSSQIEYGRVILHAKIGSAYI